MRGLFLAFVLATFLTSCADTADPLAPPEIVYGEDVCDACGMIISEERHAAATVVEVDGATEPRRFDDIGDMLMYHRDHPELTVRRWYAHDYGSGAWIAADEATFVRAKALTTPMGHGLAAFQDAEAAAALAASLGGETLTFDALRGDNP